MKITILSPQLSDLQSIFVQNCMKLNEILPKNWTKYITIGKLRDKIVVYVIYGQNRQNA